MASSFAFRYKPYSAPKLAGPGLQPIGYYYCCYYKRCCNCRSPEAAVIKQKMIYTSSKDYLKKALVGVGKEIQACDYGDLDWSTVLETLLRTEVAQ